MGLILRTNRTNLPGDVTVQNTRLTNVQMDNNFLYLHSIAGGSASIIQGPQGPAGPQGPQGPAGPQGPQGPAGSGTTASIIEVTYSELVFGLTSSSLLEGSYYKITNFRTCYDQPDFDYQNNPITTGNYKQAAIEPLVVFAISNDKISSTAYQPEYPNDRILYDWTWSETEVTGGTAYGRISERIDEFNNRTDYDHRTILFKRYRLYTYRDQPLNGTIEIFPNGSVVGTGSTFNTLVSGDVIYVPGVSPNYYEITTITDNFNMGVTGSVIGTDGAGLTFYKAFEETNDSVGYFSYKRTNVKTNDFIEYTTFGDAIGENWAKNNYVGNFANDHINTFLLANNVFLEGQYESNKFGDYCYNNTWGTDNTNNIWGDWCYENVSTNDIDDCIFGHNFYNNLINTNLTSNHIGNNFNNNKLLAGNGEDDDFKDNIIGNDFSYNIIYSRFYKNEILDNFNYNIIGDSDNLTNFSFYRNYIRDNFNENIIRQYFQNNQIGTDFGDNEIRRWFRNNTIQNNFSSNTTNGYENSNDDEFIGFDGNSVGNGFSQNEISYTFKDNTIGNDFRTNITGRRFENNNIGNNFSNNKPFNSQLFGWNNLGNLTDRSFRTFQYSLDQGVGQYVVGTEMVMRIISTGQYFKIIFTQWSQGEGQGGGGFSYNRQEIDSNGNNIGDIVYFTKENYGNEIDVIVEGVLEIKRGNNNVIYNVAVEQSADSDVSPEDTEWNCIFTEVTDVFDFEDNLIQNDFNDNNFGNSFYDNTVGNNFNQNELHGEFYDNTVGNSYTSNEIYIQFYNNSIGNNFDNNTININFYDNKIGNDFIDNETMLIFNGNTIGNGFDNNRIDSQLSGWNNLSNLAGRNYEVWRNSLDGNVGNYILDRELVMKIISTGQYFKIIFTKWTQGNGGGFSYNRQEIDSNGDNIGDIVYFTKENYTEGVDVIVEGVVEITRGEVQGIYNIATELNHSNSVSPANTEWNSIFSQQDGDIKFRNNVIGNLFDDNECLGQFAYNTIGDSFDNNIIGNNFQWNVVNTIIDNTNFTTNYGNIVEFTYTATGESGVDDTYTLPTSTNSSYGVSSTFEVEVVDNLVIGVTISNSGRLYQVGDILTILGDGIGGATPDDDIVITVTEVTVPSVYEEYTCQIFERQGGNKRLSFYDSSDILTIKNINE